MAIRLAKRSGSGTTEDGDSVTLNFWVDTEDEVYQVRDSETEYRGLPRKSWDWQTVSDKSLCAGFEVSLTFEGHDVEEEEDEEDEEEEWTLDDAVWSFRPAFEKEPIEKHPQIRELIDTYEGIVDEKTKRVSFPRTLKEKPKNERRGLVGEKGEDDELLNPLYGFSESGFLSFSGVATATYQTGRPNDALLNIGGVFKTLPANAPDFGIPSNYNWLKMPPTITETEALTRTREGIFIGRREIEARIYDVEHQFMLSPKGGWQPAVYEFIDI